MAKAFFSNESVVYPRGILILRKATIMPDGHAYDKVYSEYWDVIIRDAELLKDKDKITPKDWTWHAFKDNVCAFHITGDKVSELITEPDDDEIEGVYTI